MDPKRMRTRLGNSRKAVGGDVASPVSASAAGAPIPGQPEPGAASGSDTPQARSRKIARIRKAVSDGSYEISASDVAAKLIDHMLER